MNTNERARETTEEREGVKEKKKEKERQRKALYTVVGCLWRAYNLNVIMICCYPRIAKKKTVNKTQREPKLRSLCARFTTSKSISSSSIFRLHSVAFYRLRSIRPLNGAKFAGLLAAFIYFQFNVICQQKTV